MPLPKARSPTYALSSGAILHFVFISDASPCQPVLRLFTPMLSSLAALWYLLQCAIIFQEWGCFTFFWDFHMFILKISSYSWNCEVLRDPILTYLFVPSPLHRAFWSIFTGWWTTAPYILLCGVVVCYYFTPWRAWVLFYHLLSPLLSVISSLRRG